ncbi:CPBP family intramembrane glutamic endopeptidase [Planifilum fimeticola]
MKKNLRLILLLTAVGAIGGVTVLPYQMSVAGETPALPLPLLYVASGVQTAFLVFLFSSLGFRMAEKVNLGMPVLRSWLYPQPRQAMERKGLTLAVVGGALLTAAVVLLDQWVFSRHIPGLSQMPVVEWWKGILAVFYGGVVEEILMRLFFMTLLVWILAKLFTKGEVPSALYWIGILLSALLFGIGHLPLAGEVFGVLTPPVILRTLLANGLLAVLFGYLYWKKGLEYAMISHMTADVMLHVVLVRLV